jgi:hypothetical protein
MSSTDSTQNGANGTSGLSQAQILMQKHVTPAHEAHNPSVEEVPDEEDLKHGIPPTSSSILETEDEAKSTPEWAAPMSAKAAGKQKESAAPPKQVIDIQSEQLFPGLGGGAPKPVQARNAPGWPKINGANGTSTNGSSTPTSGFNTPPAVVSSVPRGGPQSLAGQIQAPLLVLQKHEVLPRNQLKKPMPDLLKDINKKLRTNITMTTGEGGVLEFRETSNQKESIKQQAIRDLGAQIGAKVCPDI